MTNPGSFCLKGPFQPEELINEQEFTDNKDILEGPLVKAKDIIAGLGKHILLAMTG